MLERLRLWLVIVLLMPLQTAAAVAMSACAERKDSQAAAVVDQHAWVQSADAAHAPCADEVLGTSANSPAPGHQCGLCAACSVGMALFFDSSGVTSPLSIGGAPHALVSTACVEFLSEGIERPPRFLFFRA